jgi:hypothetical protein
MVCCPIVRHRGFSLDQPPEHVDQDAMHAQMLHGLQARAEGLQETGARDEGGSNTVRGHRGGTSALTRLLPGVMKSGAVAT